MHFVSWLAKARGLAVVAFVLCPLAALGLAAAPASAGPVGLQASGGWDSKHGEFCVGAGLRFKVMTIAVIPNYESRIVDSGSAYSLNLDGTMTVLPLGVAEGYLGAGVGRLTQDPDHAESTSETVVNLIAGAGVDAVPLKPFGQFKWIVREGDDSMVTSVGIRF